MPAKVPAKQRVHRILKGLRCYLAPELCMGQPFPRGITLPPEEEVLGVIYHGRLESLLTNHGTFLHSRSGWHFIPYGDIANIRFPEKSEPDGSLTLNTSAREFQILRRNPELWEVGRFFMRCASDANQV